MPQSVPWPAAGADQRG